MENHSKNFVNAFFLKLYNTDLKTRGYLENHIRKRVLENKKIDPEFLISNFGEYAKTININEYSDKVREYGNSNINFINVSDKEFPADLIHHSKFPLSFFYKGQNLKSISHLKKIAVVGSRNCDLEAEDIAFSISQEIGIQGGVVVSGLAVGIDGASHKGAISIYDKNRKKESISTIAVLGSGLKKIYPSCHIKLSEEIIEKGGILISEFLPDTRPYPSNFLQRNQIIAALSQVVIVVQAAKRSGALSTVRTALEMGKEIIAVPGNINNARYYGTNMLIKEGATIYTSIEDLKDYIPELYQNSDIHQSINENWDSSEILNYILNNQPVHINQLLKQFSSFDNFHLELFELESQGVIKSGENGYFARHGIKKKDL